MSRTLEFGKYAGRSLETVPADYLRWLLERSRTMVEEIEEEFERRKREREAEERRRRNGHAGRLDDPALAEKIITAGYRALAQQHHPDHGGSNDLMRAINAAMEQLRQRIQEGK